MIERDRFLAQLGSELDAIDHQLDQYRSHYREGAMAGTENRTADDLRVLERHRDEIRRRSRELEDFDGEQWENERKDIEKERNNLRESLQRARDRLRH